MKAYDIQWDFDIEETVELFNTKSLEEISDFFKVPVEDLQRMDYEQFYDFVKSKFHHCPAYFDEFYGLPDEIEIPEGLTDDEDISDWLSDEYGFCHEGFKLKEGTI